MFQKVLQYEKLFLLLKNNLQLMQNVKQLLATKLRALSESISVAEKEEAMQTLKMSRPTLDKYLSGDIDKMAKVETGQELLEFFTAKVRQRIEKIRETNLV